MSAVAERPELAEIWQRARPGPRSRARWELVARPAQLTPAGGWNVWLFMAGRGAGKTRAAAEDMAYYGLTHPGSRLAVVAPTYADARDTCVEGESGLLACLPRSEVATWNRTMGELVLTNGTRYKLFSSDEPDRLRGPQHHRAWCDELAHFRDLETWDMLHMGLRLGDKPQCVATTTPRPLKLLRNLLVRSDVVVTRGSTWDNAANLAPAALDSLRRRYEGTRMGRQELEGHLLEDVEGALWKLAWIEQNRVHKMPYGGWYEGPDMGVDPSDGSADGAEHALTISAKGYDHDLYVIRNEGYRCTPYEFAVKCVRLADAYGARIILERNHGGAWMTEVFERAMKDTGIRPALRTIHASQGKLTRAEPVASLYEPRVFADRIEPGRVHHVGTFEALEDQMTGWTGAPGELSPDRLDSLVWSLHRWATRSFGPPPSEAQSRAVPYPENGNGKVRGVPAAAGAVPWR